MTVEQEPAGTGDPVSRGRPEANACLRAVIDTVTSCPDVEAMAGGVVKLVTEATGCDACVLYLLDNGHLSIRAASPEDAETEGDLFKAVVGNGPAGQPARTGQLLFIPDGTLGGSGPPGRAAPAQRRSLASVPISSRSGVVGALTVHAREANAFSPSDIDFVEVVAALVGRAVDNVELEEAAATRRGLLLDLSRLTERLTNCGSTEEILGVVAAECRALLGGERCEIFLLDDHQRLVLRAADPQRATGCPMDARRLWEELVSEQRRAVPAPREAAATADAGALAEILWGSDVGGTALFAPLRVRGASLGFIGALVTQPPPEAQRALATVASVTAFALKEREAFDRLHKKSAVREFFDALSGNQESSEAMTARAAVLGIDSEAAHIVLHAVRSPARSGERRSGPRVAGPAPTPGGAEELEGKLLAALPGIVLHRGPTSVRGVVRVGVLSSFDIHTRVRKVYAEITAYGEGMWSVGLSSPCCGSPALREGLGQATSAAEIGALVHGAPGVYTPEDLGAYRYLVSGEAIVDERQARLEVLASYDRDRSTKLFETLETWLDNKGNVVATSRALGIHQNTLRQRLTRIEERLGFDLDREDWLAVAMALKIVKLRLLHCAARGGEEENGSRLAVSRQPDSRERTLRRELTDRIAR